jgi:hypothetical protein
MLGISCAFCGESAYHQSLGPLLGPLGDTEYYVHRPCALWSPEVTILSPSRIKFGVYRAHLES